MVNILKAIYSALKKKAKREEDDADVLYGAFRGFFHYFPTLYSRTRTEDDGEGDTSSTSSCSSNATTDNIPGTGRSVDMFFYQPLGRLIERLAMRATISSLNPAQILRFIEADRSFRYFPLVHLPDPLNDTIAKLSTQRGSTYITGLKSLVKQTQSQSIHRSAAALIALIRVSSDFYFSPFYLAIVSVEPIFHVEIIAGRLDDLHPEKSFFLFLARLARANIVALSFSDSSTDLARGLRQRLLTLLESYRSASDALSVISEACTIFAQSASYIYERPRAGGPLVKIIYFTMVLILRSISDLAVFPGLMSRTQVNMVLTTLINWLDLYLYRCIWIARSTPDTELLDTVSALRGLTLALNTILPRSYFETLCSPLLPWKVLPRRIRCTLLCNEDPRIIQDNIGIHARRTQEYLNSFSELEREVRESTSLLYISSQWKANDEDDEWSDDTLRYTVERARKIRVSYIDLTNEFSAARKPYLHDDGKEDFRQWREYKHHCRRRHAWGQYFRSRLDWDLDVTHALKRMFEHPAAWSKSTSSPNTRDPLATSPAAAVDVSSGDAWKISAGPAQGTLPKEVRIAYTTQTGATKFKTFFAAPSVEELIPLCVRGRQIGHATQEDHSGEAPVDMDKVKDGYT